MGMVAIPVALACLLRLFVLRYLSGRREKTIFGILLAGILAVTVLSMRQVFSS